MGDLSEFVTDPNALQELIALGARYANRLQVKTLVGKQLLHAKLYLFKGSKQHRLVTGSANWSGPGFLSNLEHGLVLVGPDSHPVLAEADKLFRKLWRRAEVVDEELTDIYTRQYEKRRSATELPDRRARSNLKRRLSERLSKTPSVGRMAPGDKAFLSALPDELKILGERLLHQTRQRYAGKLELEGRRHSNRPDNFWTVTIQPDDRSLRISVRGSREHFREPARIKLTKGMNGYTEFKIRERAQLNGALAVIQQARKRPGTEKV